MRDDGTPPPPPAEPPAAEAADAEREADFDDFGALDADIARALDGLDGAAPGEAAPGEGAAAEAAPADAASAEAVPAEADPTEAIPTEADPTETDPTEAAPTEAVPTEAVPTEADPAEAVPAEADPTEAAPTEAAPTDPADFGALDADTIDFEDAHPDDDGCEDRELDSLVGAIPWDDEPRRGPLRIAIAGGGGGVGRTLLAANVALSLARAGRRCALVDLDPIGAGLHTALGLPPLLPAPAALFQAPPRPAPEPVPGVTLHLLRASRPVFTSPADPLRAELLEAALDRTDDVLIFDLGPAADPLTLDTWLAADVPVIVADPLPATIERAYGFLRAALWRKLLAGDEPPVRLARAVLTGDEPPHSTDPPITGPLELMRALAARDPAAADALRARLLNFTPRLVMNRTRNRADREIGLGIASALRCRWGVHAEALGAIDHDDTVLEAARRHRPLLLAYPGAAFSQALEQIATRLHTIATGRRPGR